MTLEQLLEFDAAKLEAMSDAELLAWCKPYWPTTRVAEVEKIRKEKANNIISPEMREKQEKIARAKQKYFEMFGERI